MTKTKNFVILICAKNRNLMLTSDILVLVSFQSNHLILFSYS